MLGLQLRLHVRCVQTRVYCFVARDLFRYYTHLSHLSRTAPTPFPHRVPCSLPALQLFSPIGAPFTRRTTCTCGRGSLPMSRRRRALALTSQAPRSSSRSAARSCRGTTRGVRCLARPFGLRTKCPGRHCRSAATCWAPCSRSIRECSPAAAGGSSPRCAAAGSSGACSSTRYVRMRDGDARRIDRTLAAILLFLPLTSSCTTASVSASVSASLLSHPSSLAPVHGALGRRPPAHHDGNLFCGVVPR